MPQVNPNSTFICPSCFEDLSLPALYDWHGLHSRNHPFCVFEGDNDHLRVIPWGEAIQRVHRAINFVKKVINSSPLAGDVKPVIAIISLSNTTTYLSLLIGVLRAGYIAFPISYRNSHAAVTRLLSQSGATHIFFSPEEKVSAIVTAALKDIPKDSPIITYEVPTFADLFPINGSDPFFTPEPLSSIDINETAVIYHTSGSTSFPKPINISHKALVQTIILPQYGSKDFTGCIVACHGLPLFHAMGLFVISIIVSTGYTLSIFKPQQHHTIPNPVNTLEGAIATRSEYIITTPTFVESWSRNTEDIEKLAKISGVIFGGGPLSKEIGDSLTSRGINLFTAYGLTQTLLISKFLSEPLQENWEYFELTPGREIQFLDQGNDEHELVLLASGGYRPSVINTSVNGRDGFATGDLLVSHPTKPGLWKIIGRTDDQIIHSTGEKTNPGPLEALLKQDPHVDDALMFGRGRFQCGILIMPNTYSPIDVSNKQDVSNFGSLIWQTICKMNEFAPSHSRLFKEMIIVASPTKPFLYTAKGTIRRQATLDSYKPEIDALYADIEGNLQDNITLPKHWSSKDMKQMVTRIVEGVLKPSRLIEDNADLFELVLDSLQATWIRDSILAVIGDTSVALARSLSPNLIYENPTLSKTTAYLSSVQDDSPHTNRTYNEVKRHELYMLVEEYTKDISSSGHLKPIAYPDSGLVILLTGGTGSLGSNILGHLVTLPKISRIYSMSRISAEGCHAKQKHIHAFKREPLDVSLLESSKVVFLDGGPARSDFVIEEALYDQMKSSVTHVIHCAWRVNSSTSVSSFESNIKSVRNLIDFSLIITRSRPVRLIFISSIAVLGNARERDFIPESYQTQPDSAIGMGYGESKWVSEEIIRRVQKETPLSSTIIRCGQITGGPCGAWNTHEWFPSLIKSSIYIGKLPAIDGDISWITAVEAAKMIGDTLFTTNEVLHLVHPKPSSWNTVIGYFSKHLYTPIAPYEEWLRILEEEHHSLDTVASDPAMVGGMIRANPALRLLTIFRSALPLLRNPWTEPPCDPRLDCTLAVKASYSLYNEKPIEEDNVKQWLRNWVMSGFISTEFII